MLHVVMLLVLGTAGWAPFCAYHTAEATQKRDGKRKKHAVPIHDTRGTFIYGNEEIRNDSSPWSTAVQQQSTWCCAWTTWYMTEAPKVTSLLGVVVFDSKRAGWLLERAG